MYENDHFFPRELYHFLVSKYPTHISATKPAMGPTLALSKCGKHLKWITASVVRMARVMAQLIWQCQTMFIEAKWCQTIGLDQGFHFFLVQCKQETSCLLRKARTAWVDPRGQIFTPKNCRALPIRSHQPAIFRQATASAPLECSARWVSAWKIWKRKLKKPTLKQNVTQQAALHSPAQPAPLAKWAETNFQDLAVQGVANCQDMSQLSEHLAGMRPSPILKMVQGIVWHRIKTCSTRQASFIPVPCFVVYHVISCLSFVLLPPPSFAIYWPSVNWLSATSATVFRWGLRWTTPPLPDMLDRSRPLRWKSCLKISSEECVWVKTIPKSRWFKLVQHVLILLYTTAMSQCGNLVAT